MDIFNRKRVAELERRLTNVERARDKYMDFAATLQAKFDAMAHLEETIPSDCVRGPWCKACEFVRTFHYVERYDDMITPCVIEAYVCGKGKSCVNFVQQNIKGETKV